MLVSIIVCRSSSESHTSQKRHSMGKSHETNDKGWDACKGLLSVYNKSSITVASVTEDLVCIISGDTQDITVIGVGNPPESSGRRLEVVQLVNTQVLMGRQWVQPKWHPCVLLQTLIQGKGSSI